MTPRETTNIPTHVAVIMDGNGRWARRRKMPRVFGHRQGAERVRDVVEIAGEMGVKVLTLYAFSEENWQRPADEVTALFNLLITYLKKEIKELHAKNVRFRTIGNTARLPADCQLLLKEAAELTSANTGLQLVVALSYGGRTELVEACQRISAKVARGELSPEDVDSSTIAQHLATCDLPDPDLLIRTSGELRVSNFLLWQIAYAELYFTDVNWPDFTKEHFLAAIRAFQSRERRYGRVSRDEARSETNALAIGDPAVGGFTC